MSRSSLPSWCWRYPCVWNRDRATVPAVARLFGSLTSADAARRKVRCTKARETVDLVGCRVPRWGRAAEEIVGQNESGGSGNPSDRVTCLGGRPLYGRHGARCVSSAAADRRRRSHGARCGAPLEAPAPGVEAGTCPPPVLRIPDRRRGRESVELVWYVCCMSHVRCPRVHLNPRPTSNAGSGSTRRACGRRRRAH